MAPLKLWKRRTRRAREKGAFVIALVNNPGSSLAAVADLEILVASGPEVIAGSTRLAAGTAQKATLNLLSTLTHIRLGAVHDGLMVNVEAGNAKLRRRAAGIVAAINSASLGVTAQLINTGNIATPYRIMVTGASGASNAFSLTSVKSVGVEVTSLSFGKTLQTALDATFNVDGMDMTSSKNTVTDAIAGATLNLTGITTTNVPANLVFSRDTSSISTKLNALVTAYNDANTMLGVVSDPKSSVETYGATLVGSSLVGSVRSQMRALITTSVTNPTNQANLITIPASQINLNYGVTLSSATGIPTRIAPSNSSTGFANSQSLVTAINDVSVTTKVSASLDLSGNLILTNTAGSEGADISVSGVEPNSLGIAIGIYKSQAPNALRDIGLSISAQGILQLDSAKLDSMLQTKFEGVVSLFTGNQENLSMYSQVPGGVANSAVKKLTAMVDTNSAISAQSTNLSKKISAYKLDLEKLERRMTELLTRYNKQFGAMESMVGQTNAIKTGLTSTFEGMMAAYTK